MASNLTTQTFERSYNHPPDMPPDLPDPPQAMMMMHGPAAVFSLASGTAALIFCLQGMEVAFILTMLLSLGLTAANLIVGLLTEKRRCKLIVDWVRENRRYREAQAASELERGKASTHSLQQST
jgi:hypothetical protein